MRSQSDMKRTVLAKLQSSWWFAWVAAIALGLSQVNDAVDGIDRLLVIGKFKPDSLALAQTAEKGEFSRGLTESAWRRLYWARSFQARVELGAPQAELDEAWKHYISASENWSSKIMVYIVTTENFYGREKAIELELDVQSALNEMGNSLISLRYSTPTQEALKTAVNKIDSANSILYKFVRGFSPSIS